jgi:hypothetical protein
VASTVGPYVLPFLLYGLGCLGMLTFAALLVGLVEPNFRTHSLNALGWGVPAGIVLTGALHIVGTEPSAVHSVFVALTFLAGFALGVLLYALRVRFSTVGSSNNRSRGP